MVKAHPEILKIRIEGHTDDQGKDDFNKDPSQRRADAVREYLIGKGIEPERLESVGYGEEEPIGDNSSQEGRAENRRIKLLLKA